MAAAQRLNTAQAAALPGPRMDRLDHLAGAEYEGFFVRVGCPVCEGSLVVENGVRREALGIGVEQLVVLRCAEHGPYRLEMTLTRAELKRHVPNGAEQRRKQRAREVMVDE